MNIIFQCKCPKSSYDIYFFDNGNYAIMSVIKAFNRSLMDIYSNAEDHGFWKWNAHYGHIMLHPTANRYGHPPSRYLAEATEAYKGWLRDVVAE